MSGAGRNVPDLVTFSNVRWTYPDQVTEEQRYEVLKSYAGFEVRRYEITAPIKE